MNQGIIFSDLCQWQAESNRLKFMAQQQGVNIPCYVGIQRMQQLSGKVLLEEQEILSLFEQWRFDFEDEAEALIEQECFNGAGEIELPESA
ncbi:DUF1488 domain-containing protein [Shewanella chilikensis]|uniref:DUF1488 domain-containing protein n=1 Tax=Shewanella chilikensis TaxID=558541 RepID=UPI001F3C9F0C|nr:DUF1488 domain-containing protein [Shewanella chilikensis]MCE9788575.1 DUF1488 domain-containing protein [Shewanella chilikensis]